MLGLFVQRVEIPTEAGHDAVIAYLIANFSRSRNYDKMYGASWEYQRDGRYGLVPYEVYATARSSSGAAGSLPLLQSGREQGRQRQGQPDSSSGGGMKVFSTITFIRGTLDVEKILKAAHGAEQHLVGH